MSLSVEDFSIIKNRVMHPLETFTQYYTYNPYADQDAKALIGHIETLQAQVNGLVGAIELLDHWETCNWVQTFDMVDELAGDRSCNCPKSLQNTLPQEFTTQYQLEQNVIRWGEAVYEEPSTQNLVGLDRAVEALHKHLGYRPEALQENTEGREQG